MYESIKKNIIYDINLFYNSIIKFLIILAVIISVGYRLISSELIPFYIATVTIIIILLIKTIIDKNNSLNIKINLSTTSDSYQVIKIFNKKNIKHIFYDNSFNIFIYPIIYLLNLGQIKMYNIMKTFIRTISYNNNYSVIRYPNSFIVPDKCIVLLNHSWILNQDITNIYQSLLLFPEHRYIIITRNIYTNNRILQFIGNKIGNTLCQQYIITSDNKDTGIYRDIYEYVSNNKKVVVFIFPEGNVYRTTSIKNYDVNKENIDNFDIYDYKCFKYKKGAFIISLMLQIPIIHSIFYSPIPNYDYNYMNNIYKIKHINHLGIKFYNPEIVMNQDASFDEPCELSDVNIKKYIDINYNNIQQYMNKMEQKFYERYIETLLESHNFNIVS